MEVAGEKLEILIAEKFMIEKGSFVEWMAASELTYLWKKGWLQVLVSEKHSTLENSRSLQVTS